MEKVKNFILSVNFIATIFVLIGLRITFVGASIGDALTILSICGLQAFYKWVETQKQENIGENLQKELADIKSHVSALAIKNSIRPTGPSADAPVMKKFF